MITMEMVYWIIMLDKISTAFLLFSLVFGIPMVLITVGLVTNGEDLPWHYPVWVVVELFFICGAVFLPNTKQMATIYVLPKIVNNEKVQSIGERTLDTGDKLLQLMQQYIAEKMTDGKRLSHENKAD